ncbi:glycosyltransferase [Candidatus Parcubacteria bacterium]|nr:MAG: glycosyltransferase [Candidatus Parcubacteria bacterium]
MLKIYISKKPEPIGGGSNTFSVLFQKWVEKNGYKIVVDIANAQIAIIIAHLADINQVINAKEKGCCIVHRLDEYFGSKENENRKHKHDKIIFLNKYADLTIFQSIFVFNNVYPYIKPKKYCVIHNGSDPEKFYPGKKSGQYIGHITWGIDTKKRLDLLLQFIERKKEENFILIGRHAESRYNFNIPNVRLIGKIKHKKIAKYFRMMKLLYFPSENDPCPNTAIEAILSGVPVCYNQNGGTAELVNPSNNFLNAVNIERCGNLSKEDLPKSYVCGLPLDQSDMLLQNLDFYRLNCLKRKDLHFDNVFKRYFNAINQIKSF